MKKYAWILALFLALTMVFIGCPDKDDDDEKDDEGEDDVVTELTVTQSGVDGMEDIPEDERASGKGYIVGEDFNKVKAAAEGSYIQLTITGTENLDWGSIGAVGINGMEDSEGNRCDFAPKSGGTYTIKVMTADIFKLTGADTASVIHINIWGNHKIDKVELVVPKDGEGEEPTEPKKVILPDFSYNKGDGDSDGAESQVIWRTNGTDDEENDLTVEDIVTAKYLVIVLGNAPAGGMQLIWQSDVDSWGWNQTASLLTNSGGENSEVGTSLSTDKKTLTIELSKAITKYSTFITAQSKLKIILAYYTSATKIRSLDIQEAYLLYE